MISMSMMMAKNWIRAPAPGMVLHRRTALRRTFSCAAPLKGVDQRLYRRLSALGAKSPADVAGTMEAWVKEGKAVTESKMVNIVQELRRYKSYHIALKVANWMEERRIGINSTMHAIRLDLIAKVKGVDKAERYFNSLPELMKNHLTYGALLNTYCQEKMADKAFTVYEKMKELKIASGALNVNNLMNLHMKLGQPEKALALFKEMKEANIRPDRFTYGILMTNHASRNDIESVDRVVEEIKKDGYVNLDWTLYCNLAGYYNTAGLFVKSLCVLQKAEKIMHQGQRDPYHYLITLYAGAGNLAEVKRVWNLLKIAFPRTTNKSYFHMFHALKRLGDLDGLNHCFAEWESVCVSFDVKLVNVVIDAHLRMGKVKEAEALWERATKKGFGSDFKILELFADYYLRKHDIASATNFLRQFTCIVKQEKQRLDEKKVNAFLFRLNKVRGMDGMEEFHHRLKNLCFSEM